MAGQVLHTSRFYDVCIPARKEHLPISVISSLLQQPFKPPKCAFVGGGSLWCRKFIRGCSMIDKIAEINSSPFH